MNRVKTSCLEETPTFFLFPVLPIYFFPESLPLALTPRLKTINSFQLSLPPYHSYDLVGFPSILGAPEPKVRV